jgi:hypothetical protein
MAAMSSSSEHGVRLIKEVRVEELVVEVDNGHNVVLVRDVVPPGAHVGKWPNRLRAGSEDSSLKAPYGGRRPRVVSGGRWMEGLLFLAVGAASGHRRCPWRRQRWKGGGARAAGQHRGRGGGNGLVTLSARPGADKGDARKDARAVRTDVFRAQI